ncbi:uncharacterized protein LOC120648278 [Panicum virgatum]|uniref:uncharacterized protein LOC120648278 n=1 Tax=Panicum virgatum TaxID=38727 RepID=UPI0019D5D459|nr:uncharacterized protein LOC120648278 [Panicum virgatum]
MAVGFRRRLTAFGVPKAALLRRTRHKKLSYSRVRSHSLPGRFHPVVAGLHDSANALIAWAEEPAPASPAWVGDGVAHLGRLLAGLTDLLHHPQARDPLQRRSKTAPWTERLLDDLLLLADAHGCFREALLVLSEAAVVEAVAAATCAAAAASAAIFAGLASASASSSSRAMPSPLAVSPAKVAAVPVWWVADLLRWRRRTVAVAASESGPAAKEVPLEECCNEEEERQAAMDRLRRLEECVVAAEDGCEQVYRALVNARVSLLNVLTPCF